MQIVNAPQKVNVAPALLKADVDRWTGQTDDPDFDATSAVFFTEVADAARAAVLATVTGFALTHKGGPGKGECAILTREGRRKVIAQQWIKITEGGGSRRFTKPVWAPVVVTEGTGGRITLLTNSHLLAHLERHWSLIPLPMRLKVKVLLARPNLSPTIRLWIEAATAWRDAVDRLAGVHEADDIVVAADWNLNGKRAWVRALMAHLWPDLKLVQTKGPDLGKRTVGWLLTTMALDEGQVYPAKASDHRAGRYVLSHVKTPPPPPPTKPSHGLTIPGAHQHPIPKTDSDPFIIPVGSVFHIAVSNTPDLHGQFTNGLGIESTGYILRDGTIIQYRPLNVECDAQFDGNSWIEGGKRFGLNSWETQGGVPDGGGVWTPEQIASIKLIIDFQRDEWEVPSRVCPGPTSPGFGYHRLFDAWNHNHHSCPGDGRVAQFKRVIVPHLEAGTKR